MPDIVPTRRAVTGEPRETLPTARLTRRTSRALDAIEQATIVRTARVVSEGTVQAQKLREIDHLAREALSGHALLRQWRNTLATDDPFVADELKFFVDVAKVGKGEILADTIDHFCREARP